MKKLILYLELGSELFKWLQQCFDTMPDFRGIIRKHNTDVKIEKQIIRNSTEEGAQNVA